MNDWEIRGTQNKWVCPSDRHLQLRAQLKSGWSSRTGPTKSPTTAKSNPAGISEAEQAHIRDVIARADAGKRSEQERIGKLVERLDNMRRRATGNGVTQCMLCSAEFGLLGSRSYGAMCHDCRKYVCQKNCGLETYDQKRADLIFLCKICSENREMWKKSGAWFFKEVPEFMKPSESGAESPNGAGAGPKVSMNWTHQRGRQPANGADSTDEDEQHAGNGASASRSNIKASSSAAGRSQMTNSPASSSRRFLTGTPEQIRSRSTPRPKITPSWVRDNVAGSSMSIGSEEEDSSSSEDAYKESGIAVNRRQNRPKELAQKQSDSHSLISAGLQRIAKSNESRNLSITVARKVSNSTPQPAAGSSPEEESKNQLRPQQKQSFKWRKPIIRVFSQRHGKPSTSRHITTEPERPSSASFIHRSVNPFRSPRTSASMDFDFGFSLGTLEFSLTYKPEENQLIVHLIRAKRLKAMDSNGFSDPYVKLHLIPGNAKATKLTSKTIEKTLNPEWNERLVYYGVTEDDRMKKTLRLTVLDRDRIGSDFLGETRIALRKLPAGKERHFDMYLESALPVQKSEEVTDCERGKILLSLCYNVQQGSLLVGIKRCVELVGLDSSGYSDPYVKLALTPPSSKSHRQKTAIKKKTLNPEFNEVVWCSVLLLGQNNFAIGFNVFKTPASALKRGIT
uniref:Uncharacterized protein n=1 Tax=Plectus sambesii TaxID=2011161 RepID=A0A914WES2_9BILA